MNLGSNNNNERKQFNFDLNFKPVEDDNSDIPEDPDLCTICLDPLVTTQDDRRALVTLTCGHKFHLDCIGSAFNAKGIMQCPNCMQIDPGQWRYASNAPFPVISEGDWFHQEEEDDANSVGGFNVAVASHFNNHGIPLLGQADQRAQPSNQQILSGGMTWGDYLAPPSSHHTPTSSSLFLPFPDTSTVPVNRTPSLLDLSALGPDGNMLPSGSQQVPGGISHSWTTNLTYVRRPSVFGSSSREGGTSVDGGDGIGASRSNGRRGGGGRGRGGRGRGGRGNRNGISGGSHLSGRRPH